MPSDTPMPFAAEFPAPSHDAWLRLVEKVLKGADFEKRLVSRSADGVRIAPLYTLDDARPGSQTATPGRAPFERGGPDAAARDGWDIRQRVTEPDPARANAAILADLEGGVTSLAIDIAAPGRAGLATSDLGRALDGVLLDVCPVVLEAGEAFEEAAAALDGVWAGHGIDTATRRGSYGADPIGTLAQTGGATRPIAAAVLAAGRLAARSRHMPGVTALLADGRPYHAAGASEAQELGIVLATLVAYLRASEAAGLAPADAVSKIAVALAADTDQFMTMAKFRAARGLVWRIAAACGTSETAGSVHLTGETATRVLARRDPWVNMLRGTMACAAAALGGADAITVLPFTHAMGRPDAFARRIARNTQIILQEESALGRVADPAGGSWYVERLTDVLSAAAWAVFQEIEAAGGIVAALQSGYVQDKVAETADARRRMIVTGRTELTGVSAFPRLGDDGVTAEPHPAPAPVDATGCRIAALPAARLAAPFEALRDRADCAMAGGRAPQVFLANLGSLADFATRATWITNYLAAGGIHAIASEGFTDTKDVGAAFATSGATVACLCGTDAAYAAQGEAAAGVLKAAGAAHVCLAGRPKEQEAALRAAGVDTFLHAGSDAIETLTRLHAALATPG